jgi:hypothetical protein
MDNFPFIGRKAELQRLEDLLKKKTASLVVIKGRRRIGKSRLAEEFARGKQFLQFSGLPPVVGVTDQDQRDEFSRMLSQQTGLPEIKTDDWGKLFALLGEKIQSGRVIVLLDEISWMGQNDPHFLAKLKNAWDLSFKKNDQLILILCGSVSAWIEKNILSSTGYFGRISEKITLNELSVQECNQLLTTLGFKRSAMEKLVALSLTGGIPWYIEQINPAYSAADNIKRLCFQPDGILVDEYRHIFHDLFGKKGAIYEKIAGFLAKQNGEYKEIVAATDYASSGALTEYLNDLQTSGYIEKYPSWDLSTGKENNISFYRLTDCYLRFYYRYIQPRKNKILRGELSDMNVATLPAWPTIMGLQFENLVLNNRKWLHEKLRIRPEDIVASNPYYQRATKKRPGCQIDYLIQTRLKTLFVCEIKFSVRTIDATVIKEVQEKIQRLSIPRGFACVPVLIHCHEVSDEVATAGYFFECINFGEFLA